MCSLAKDIGIDLGTASVLIYVKDKGIVLNEPSVVAIDKDTGKLLKVGADAQAMLGRTPGNIVAIRPLREGVISDYEVTERMLKEFIHKVMGFQFFKPRIIICVPSGITEVEERAVIDAGIQAGARRVYLIEEPVAAAIGAGIDITQPDGHFIIDIGGGTSDIAVISLSGVVESASIKVAGDQFNEAVVKYMRRKHNLLIGERTAEEMKMSIGCVFPPEEEMTMEIKGRCLLTGLPKLITVTSTEMMGAFEEPVERIMEAVHQVLERTPPELVADISSNGIVMTGGGSLEGTHLDLTEISWFSCRDERIKNVLYGWKIPLFDENAGNMGTPKAMGACCFPLYFLKGKLISQGLDFFNDLHDPFHPSAAVPGKGLLENWDGRIKVEP